MLGGISIWQLLILLAIVVMVFGTKRLRNLGGDLGGALKDFRGAMKHSEDDDEAHKKTSQDTRTHADDSSSDSKVIDQELGSRPEDADQRQASEKSPSEDRRS